MHLNVRNDAVSNSVVTLQPHLSHCGLASKSIPMINGVLDRERAGHTGKPSLSRHPDVDDMLRCRPTNLSPIDYSPFPIAEAPTRCDVYIFCDIRRCNLTLPEILIFHTDSMLFNGTTLTLPHFSGIRLQQETDLPYLPLLIGRYIFLLHRTSPHRLLNFK
ncbi:hypothetical protein TNCV_1848731 [Trichonephila clavipes]|nr:hypothetical protein TNCV_1848731 [Trichonephila clavipes]